MQGAWPSFDLSGVELLLALVRGLFVAALLSTFGASLFSVLIAPAALKQMRDAATELNRSSLVVARCGALSALLLMPAWLALQAGNIADAESPIQALAAIPSVAWDTRFGHILTAQGLVLLATAIALLIEQRRGLLMATALAGSATLLQAGHTHALAMHDGPLLFSQGVHLIAAGAWLGGLLPLFLLVRDAPPGIGAVAAERFSPLGLCCICLIAATATFQGWRLGGGLSGVVGTAYGWVLLTKAGLFIALLALAALNHFRFAPALARQRTQSAAMVLTCSIASEIAVGLLVVLAAAVLSSLEPGMHAHLSGATP